jgi:hypothetical protein
LKNCFTPYIYILFFISLNSFSQELKLRLEPSDSISKIEFQNLKFQKNNLTPETAKLQIDSITKQLKQQGFLFAKGDFSQKTDSVFIVKINRGKFFQKLTINYTASELIKTFLLDHDISTKNNTFELKINEIEFRLNQLVLYYEKKGFSFTEITLKNINTNNGNAIADLDIEQSNYRTIDKVIVKGFDHFPKSFIKYRLDIKSTTIFNSEKLKDISNTVKLIPFAKEIKKPEVLFTKDSTHLYVYLKPQKSNRFDGIIGFSSKENKKKLEFNGYLDLHLQNILNYGEIINLLWKSNGDDSQKFKLELEAPYIFNSPLSTKASFQIFRQDSTYINLKSDFDLIYYLNKKHQISGKFRYHNSSVLLKNQINDTDDFTNLFYGISYNYQTYINSALFPIRFQFDISSLFGNRKTVTNSEKQIELSLKTFYNWQLNSKNYLFIKNTSKILLSDSFLSNELYRIGGSNSIRGFQEESIFTSSFSFINLEYRYKTNPMSYIYSLTDFGFTENKLTNTDVKLFSFGLGYAFQTKLGRLNLSYAFGNTSSQDFDLKNGNFHLKFISFF